MVHTKLATRRGRNNGDNAGDLTPRTVKLLDDCGDIFKSLRLSTHDGAQLIKSCNYDTDRINSRVCELFDAKKEEDSWESVAPVKKSVALKSNSNNSRREGARRDDSKIDSRRRGDTETPVVSSSNNNSSAVQSSGATIISKSSAPRPVVPASVPLNSAWARPISIAPEAIAPVVQVRSRPQAAPAAAPSVPVVIDHTPAAQIDKEIEREVYFPALPSGTKTSNQPILWGPSSITTAIRAAEAEETRRATLIAQGIDPDAEEKRLRAEIQKQHAAAKAAEEARIRAEKEAEEALIRQAEEDRLAEIRAAEQARLAAIEAAEQERQMALEVARQQAEAAAAAKAASAAQAEERARQEAAQAAAAQQEVERLARERLAILEAAEARAAAQASMPAVVLPSFIEESNNNSTTNTDGVVFNMPLTGSDSPRVVFGAAPRRAVAPQTAAPAQQQQPEPVVVQQQPAVPHVEQAAANNQTANPITNTNNQRMPQAQQTQQHTAAGGVNPYYPGYPPAGYPNYNFIPDYYHLAGLAAYAPNNYGNPDMNSLLNNPFPGSFGHPQHLILNAANQAANQVANNQSNTSGAQTGNTANGQSANNNQNNSNNAMNNQQQNRMQHNGHQNNNNNRNNNNQQQNNQQQQQNFYQQQPYGGYGGYGLGYYPHYAAAAYGNMHSTPNAPNAGYYNQNNQNWSGSHQ